MRAYVALVERTAGDPSEVAKLIVELIEHPDPALRHPIGQGSRVRDVLARMAPYAVIEWLIPKVFDHTLRRIDGTPNPRLRRDRA
jgi:hypothetical protein